MDDNMLMKLVQQGDKDAYNRLVLKYMDTAILFANSFVKNYDTAQDIVQDCFVKIYINCDRYHFNYTFKTFLFHVVRNRCIDVLRVESPGKIVEFSPIFEVQDQYTPENLLLKKEMLSNIFHQLDQLPEHYKTAIYLYSVEQMSYQQIAKIMKKTVSQIKIIIYRGRQKLKKQVKGGL